MSNVDDVMSDDQVMLGVSRHLHVTDGLHIRR